MFGSLHSFSCLLQNKTQRTFKHKSTKPEGNLTKHEDNLKNTRSYLDVLQPESLWILNMFQPEDILNLVRSMAQESLSKRIKSPTRNCRVLS